ncbi:MAG: GNAT family N-acetyltransferase, partial [Sphingobacteriales bacterium]
MEYIFRKAKLNDLDQIWLIMQTAIERRKKDGSQQWQDGYPNPEVIKNDILDDAGFAITDAGIIAGYCSIRIN